MANLHRDIEPAPEGHDSRMAGHWWLQRLDYDGHSHGFVVRQWNPVAEKWSHSGAVATGDYVSCRGWRLIAPCPMPPLS